MKARSTNDERRPLRTLGVMMGLLTLLAAGAVHAQGGPQCVSVLPATVEMNTAVVGDLVKTIVMEKEVFHCFNAPESRGLNPPPTVPESIVDVQLFTELTEQRVGDTFATIETAFDAVICSKFVYSARLQQCQSIRIPRPQDPATLSGCAFESPFGGHPVAMTTVTVGDLVKTIKAQKEVFSCPSSDGKVFVDFTTFTHIVEKAEDDGFTQTQKNMQAAVCRKLLKPVSGAGFGVPAGGFGIDRGGGGGGGGGPELVAEPVGIVRCDAFPVPFRE